jgi:hypothetical protein
MDDLSPELLRERDRIVALVHEAFAGVSRRGGISWNEAQAIDDHGYADDKARAAARARDTEATWTDLVADAHWRPSPTGFTFLDARSMPYYFAASLVRGLMNPKEALDCRDIADRGGWLTPAQRSCAAHVVRFEICRQNWDLARRILETTSRDELAVLLSYMNDWERAWYEHDVNVLRAIDESRFSVIESWIIPPIEP